MIRSARSTPAPAGAATAGAGTAGCRRSARASPAAAAGWAARVRASPSSSRVASSSNPRSVSSADPSARARRSRRSRARSVPPPGRTAPSTRSGVGVDELRCRVAARRCSISASDASSAAWRSSRTMVVGRDATAPRTSAETARNGEAVSAPGASSRRPSRCSMASSSPGSRSGRPAGVCLVHEGPDGAEDRQVRDLHGAAARRGEQPSGSAGGPMLDRRQQRRLPHPRLGPDDAEAGALVQGDPGPLFDQLEGVPATGQCRGAGVVGHRCRHALSRPGRAQRARRGVPERQSRARVAPGARIHAAGAATAVRRGRP